MEENKTQGEPIPADQDAGMIQEAFEGFDAYEIQPELPTVLKFKTADDPELDPESPQFNAAKFREYLSSLDISEIEAYIKETSKTATEAQLAAVSEINLQGFPSSETKDAAAFNLTEFILLSSLVNYLNQEDRAPVPQHLLNLLEPDSTMTGAYKIIIDNLRAGRERRLQLRPFLEKELPSLHEKPGFENTTAEDIEAFLELDGITVRNSVLGKPIPEPIRDTLEAALTKARRAATFKKRKAADAQGALAPIENLTFYSSEALQDALNSNSIYRLPGSSKDFAFDEKGKLNKLSLAGKLEDLTEYHTAAFAALLTKALAAYENEWQPELDSVELYLPDFFNASGIDPRPTSAKRDAQSKNLAALRRDYFLNLIAPFDNLVGTPDGGKSFYRMIALTSYNEETEVARIATPYFFRLAEIKDDRLNRLLHPDVMTEKNTAAVELASVILNGLLRRGRSRPDYQTYKSPTQKRLKKETVKTTLPDGSETITERIYVPATEQDALELSQKQKERKFTYSTQYSSLIEKSPQLAYKLNAIEASNKEHKAQLYNNALGQTFTAAYRIILEKSDVHLYFADFQIADVTTGKDGKPKYRPPTKSLLKKKLVITHSGKPKT